MTPDDITRFEPGRCMPLSPREGYNAWAETYGAGATIQRWNAALWRQNLADDLCGRRILDIGCGTGAMGDFCAVRGARSIVGMDLSEQMIHVAGGGGRSGCTRHFCVADAAALPFRAGTFDGAISSLVLSHITPERQRDVLLSIVAALKNDCIVALSDITADATRRGWEVSFKPSSGGYLRRIASYEIDPFIIEETLRELGFAETEVILFSPKAIDLEKENADRRAALAPFLERPLLFFLHGTRGKHCTRGQKTHIAKNQPETPRDLIGHSRICLSQQRLVERLCERFRCGYWPLVRAKNSSMAPAEEWPSPRVTAQVLVALRHIKDEPRVSALSARALQWLTEQKHEAGYALVAGSSALAPDVLTTAWVVEAFEVHGHKCLACEMAKNGLQHFAHGADSAWEEIGVARLEQAAGNACELSQERVIKWFSEAMVFVVPWFRADRLLYFEAHRLCEFQLPAHVAERLVAGPSGNEVHETMLYAVGLTKYPENDPEKVVLRPAFLAPPGVYLGAGSLIDACLLEGLFQKPRR